MTRDEAVELIKTRIAKLPMPLPEEVLTEIAESDVDVYVALGMLKLTEG